MRKLIRGSIRGQWIAPGLLALLTVVLSIVAGIAVTDPRLQVFVHPSEYLGGLVLGKSCSRRDCESNSKDACARYERSLSTREKSIRCGGES